MAVIQCKDLTKSYGRKHALDGLSCAIEENKITGIIGRNGAGKTTFLKIAAGFFRESSGEVTVFGEKPFNSLNVSANSIMIDQDMTLPTILKLGEIIEEAKRFYPNFDRELAFRLLSYFSLDEKLYVSNLSKGMRSTFCSILGLSARCALTIFDEPTLGMDASVRKDFYRALLKDFIAYPRTILFSSHHLEEIEDLLEDVLLVHKGKKLLHVSIDEMKEWAIAVQGAASVMKEWIEKKDVLFTKEIGSNTTYAVVKNDLTHDECERLKDNGLMLSAVTATDLCVYLMNESKGGLMMSFVQMNKSEVVRKQYAYKLEAYKGSYSSLLIIQMIGLLFSTTLAYGSVSGSSSGNFNYEYQVYSTDISVVFTLLWAFITGMAITSHNYRYDDFSFVTNRQTSNISNALYLLTISVIGGMTATLLGFAYRLLSPLIITSEVLATPYTLSDLVIGITALTLYCVFFTSLGYLVGMLVQFNKVFKYILPIVFIGLLLGFHEFMLPIFKMYFLETSLLLFFLKTAVMFSVCLLLAIGISNRMEVRK